MVLSRSCPNRTKRIERETRRLPQRVVAVAARGIQPDDLLVGRDDRTDVARRVAGASSSASAARTACSRASAARYISCAVRRALTARRSARRTPADTNGNPSRANRFLVSLVSFVVKTSCSLSQLRIDFVEVVLVDQHLARLAAGGRRDEAFHLHHVDEPRGAAEADAQPALQVRNRRLAALDDDARRLVVEVVLLHLDRRRPPSSPRP